MKRWGAPLAALAILALNVWLCLPMFQPGELPFRGSIEGGYVSMARFVSEHPNPWGWNPYQYCGLPLQFVYVPALPYVTAFFTHVLPHASPGTAYRWVVALMTCLGPVTLFGFALYFTRSLRWSFAMGLAYSLISPSYALFPAVETDRGLVQLPWRIQVLAKYGEGPHDTGLTLLPLVLLAAWLAGKKGGYPRILTAAALMAIIPLVNWVAALSLAISSLLLLLAAWREPDFRASRVFTSAGLAYLLACFWLTPSFVKTIVFNWPADSFGYALRLRQIGSLAGMILGALIIRWLFLRLRGSFYFCFAVLGTFVFGWIATGYYLFGLDTIPESRRYAIEFELFVALALVEALRLALRHSNGTIRMCALGTGFVVLAVGAPQIWKYATQSPAGWAPVAASNTIEYQLGEWIAQHPPQGRVFASGGLRFRLNSWFDVAQVGGGFETGLRNRAPLDLAYRIRTGSRLRPGHESDDTILALKALGTQYVVVHGPKSREYYRDSLRPDRISSVLPAVYQAEDDTIYALPPRPLAHLVKPEELPPEDAREHLEKLASYVAAMEEASRPGLDLRWIGTSRLTITGPAPAGQVISLQVNADPGWRAVQDGRGIATSQDGLGFLVLHPEPAASTRIELEYRGTAEQRVFAAISALAWIAALLALGRRLWGRR